MEKQTLNECAVAELEHEFMPPPVPLMPPTLYHYTDQHGFLGMLGESVAWATYFPYMNDREELIGGERIIDELARKGLASTSGHQRRFYEAFLEEYDPRRPSKILKVCIVSLSEEPDLLSQWRAYAAGGGGYSIGFPDLPVPVTANPNAEYTLALMRCEYDPSAIRDEAARMLERLSKAYGDRIGRYDRQGAMELGGLLRSFALRQAAVIALRFKDRHFREEKEWRLVGWPTSLNNPAASMRYRASARGLIPYIPINLGVGDKRPSVERVVVGPTQDPERGREAAALFVSSLGYDPSVVKNSEIPFRG